jgi:hypothetical protein
LTNDLDALGRQLEKATEAGQIAVLSIRQAEIMARLATMSSAQDRGIWLRRAADSLMAASDTGSPHDRNACGRLAHLEAQAQQASDSSAAAYVAFRKVRAEHTAFQNQLESHGKADKVQLAQHLTNSLAEYVRAYPQGDDTPAALLALANLCDEQGARAEAHLWYEVIVRDHARAPEAHRAIGAMHRMDQLGRVLHLALPLLESANERQDIPFDIDTLRGHAVVVYCWSATEPRSAVELEQLKAMLKRHAGKGLQLVCVNLDADPTAAKSFVSSSGAPGVHVFQRGGRDGLWAGRRGVQDLPYLMLVDAEGRVVRQGMLVDSLEPEIKKLEK